jgi:hypothetical protein
MAGRSRSGGSKDRFSSKVTEDEKGLNQFQLLYQLASPLVLFSWTGGLCAVGWKGWNAVSFVREKPRPSVTLDKDGPGTEVGKVKNNVISAKTAMLPNSCATRRGVSGGIGLPKSVCCLGIMQESGHSSAYNFRFDC